MKFYCILESTNNRIINRYSNLNTKLKDIVKNPDPNIKYILIGEIDSQIIYISISKYLTDHYNSNTANITISQLLNDISDVIVDAYAASDSFPNILKNVYAFDVGDILNKITIKSFNPTTHFESTSFSNPTCTDLVIYSRLNKDCTKVLPVFDDTIYYNNGNSNSIVIENIRNTIVDKFHNALPKKALWFLDFSLANTHCYRLSQLPRNKYTFDLSNLKLDFDIKSIILVLNGKLVSIRTYTFNYEKKVLAIYDNLIKYIDSFQDLDSILTNPNSFIICLDCSNYFEYFFDIKDIISSSYFYSMENIPLNSILILDTKTNNLVPSIILKSQLKDQNSQLVFGELFNSPDIGSKIISSYPNNFNRYQIMFNNIESNDPIPLPLYEEYQKYCPMYKDNLVPFRIILGNE